MTVLDLLGLAGGILTIICVIWGGTAINGWRAEMGALRKEFDRHLVMGETCRAEVLAHHQSTAVHRDPDRDDETLKNILQRLTNIENAVMALAKNGNALSKVI